MDARLGEVISLPIKERRALANHLGPTLVGWVGVGQDVLEIVGRAGETNEHDIFVTVPITQQQRQWFESVSKPEQLHARIQGAGKMLLEALGGGENVRLERLRGGTLTESQKQVVVELVDAWQTAVEWEYAQVPVAELEGAVKLLETGEDSLMKLQRMSQSEQGALESYRATVAQLCGEGDVGRAKLNIVERTNAMTKTLANALTTLVQSETFLRSKGSLRPQFEGLQEMAEAGARRLVEEHNQKGGISIEQLVAEAVPLAKQAVMLEFSAWESSLQEVREQLHRICDRHWAESVGVGRSGGGDPAMLIEADEILKDGAMIVNVDSIGLVLEQWIQFVTKERIIAEPRKQFSTLFIAAQKAWEESGDRKWSGSEYGGFLDGELKDTLAAISTGNVAESMKIRARRSSVKEDLKKADDVWPHKLDMWIAWRKLLRTWLSERVKPNILRAEIDMLFLREAGHAYPWSDQYWQLLNSWWKQLGYDAEWQRGSSVEIPRRDSAGGPSYNLTWELELLRRSIWSENRGNGQIYSILGMVAQENLNK